MYVTSNCFNMFGHGSLKPLRTLKEFPPDNPVSNVPPLTYPWVAAVKSAPGHDLPAQGAPPQVEDTGL